MMGRCGLATGFSFLALSFLLVSLFWAVPASAQVSFGADGGGTENTVCSFQGWVGITKDGDCSDQGWSAARYIKVGPDGSQINLEAETGEATFGAKATFSANVNLDALTQIHEAVINKATISGNLSVENGASVNMGGNRITNVADPEDDNDAATKGYVDNLMTNGGAKDAAQDTRIEQVDSDSRLRDGALDDRITGVDTDSKARDTAQNGRMSDIEAYNTVQDGLIATNAGDIAALDSRVDGLDQRMMDSFSHLDGRIDKAYEGAAMAMAMAAPAMPYDKNYAVSINWGNFEGKSAFAGTAQARISDHLMIHGGVGYGSGSHSVGGRAGLTFSW